jgi:hypothetical protein
LLALNDHINSAAIEKLGKASQEGHINSKAVLGLFYFKYDSLLKSTELLTKAALEETSIPDTYAALSQILDYYGLRNASDNCMAKFGELTELVSFDRQPFTIMEKDHDAIKEILDRFAKNFNPSFAEQTPVAVDTTTKEAVPDTTAASRIPDIDAGSYFESFLPEFTISFVIYIIVIALILYAFIYFSYKNWKKNKLEQKKKATQQRKKHPNNNPKQQAIASQTAARQAAAAYAKQAENAKKKEVPEKENKPIAKKETPKSKPAPSPTGIENFEEKLQMIAEQLLRAKQSGGNTNEDENEGGSRKSGNLGSVNARVDLAMHLQHQQKLVKERNIDLIKGKEMPQDQKKLMEIAKNMGLEVGSVETTKNISNLEKDEDVKKRLSAKFGSDKKTNEE